ncbi:hypothetical protein [Gordonia phthalatica]|nr:hypothetical protein [Gordonia phthalatica]
MDGSRQRVLTERDRYQAALTLALASRTMKQPVPPEATAVIDSYEAEHGKCEVMPELPPPTWAQRVKSFFLRS